MSSCNGTEGQYGYASQQHAHSPNASETLLLTDEEERIFVFGVGPPANDDTWQTLLNEFMDALRDAQSKLRFGSGDRRGSFQTVAVGISYGGGEMVSDTIHGDPSR